MLVSFNPNIKYNQNFTALSNTKKVYDYLISIAKKPVSEIKDELLSKIAKAKDEKKTFEVQILETKARELGLIK